MKKNLFLSIVVFLASSILAIENAAAQFVLEDVIVSEFYDDILRVNNGSVTDLFDIAQSDNISSIAIADSTTAYVVNFTEIWRVDLVSNSVTTLATISGTSPSEIAMDLNGDLLVVTSSNGVERVNTATGAVTLVYDDIFFSADDIAVSAEGHIYVTEFFGGLGRINDSGGWTKLGDWDTDFFSHVAMGPDGYLYLATEHGDIYRVNPTSGAGIKIFDDVFTFIDDLKVSASGLIYLAGEMDTDGDGLVESMVMTLDWQTGDVEIVVDENMVGDPRPPFFNPIDIEIFDGMFYFSAPAEVVPTTLTVNRGSLSNGGVTELAESDDQYAVLDPLFHTFRYQLQFTVASTSPTSAPSKFEFSYESKALNFVGTVEQEIDLFNYDIGQFETVDTRLATSTDSVVTLTPGGDPARFVQPGTNAIQARISYQNSLPFWVFNTQNLYLPYRVRADQVLWTISP